MSQSDEDRMLDQAIEVAEKIAEELQEAVLNLNKRKHPTPSRYQRRKENNFIQAKFNNAEDLPEDFMVSCLLILYRYPSFKGPSTYYYR